jgi:hypothetical protein
LKEHGRDTQREVKMRGIKKRKRETDERPALTPSNFSILALRATAGCEDPIT